jgi:hypothetical protein
MLKQTARGDRIFATRLHPDHSRSSMAFAAEGDLDPERPQKSLGAPQPAGKRPRRFGPAGAARGHDASPAIGADPQQMSGGAGPGAALGHEFADIGRHRVSLYGIVNCSSLVVCIGPRESASGPKRGFAGARPNRKSAIRGSSRSDRTCDSSRSRGQSRSRVRVPAAGGYRQ